MTDNEQNQNLKSALKELLEAVRSSLTLNKERWLSREEAAIYCGGIHPITFDRTVRKRLPVRELPGTSKPIFDPREIDQAIRANQLTDPEIERLLAEPVFPRVKKKAVKPS